jgi:serine/threonine protein kinase
MHFSPDSLTDYALGLLGEEEASKIAEHLAHCRQCDAEMTRLDGAADTVVARLRSKTSADPFVDESGCGAMLAAIKTMGIQTAPAEGDSVPTVDSVPTGELPRIGEYCLLEKIGEGGMGAVYRAVHTRLGKTVAIKLLPPKRVRAASAVERFQREMLAVGRLNHPNIVQATDAGEYEGAPFLVMEFIEGIDLSRLVRRIGPLNPADACEIVRQAALGLQEAHDRGLVHRDVKPSNLMLAAPRGAQAPTVKLLDLGLALLRDPAAGESWELTGDGQIVGTVDYMAPEQASNAREVDIRVDIYALGMTLRRLLGGDASAKLASIIARMTAPAPNDRYALPRQVVQALSPFAAAADLAALLEQAQHGTANRSALPPEPNIARRRWIWLAIAACPAAAAIVGLLTTWSPPPASIEPAPTIVHDYDREVAMWLAKTGNRVGIQSAGRFLEISTLDEVPAGPFRVRTVRLDKSNPTDEEWAALAQLEELRTLSIFLNPYISDAPAFDDHDAEQIAQCRALTHLYIDGAKYGHHQISDRGLMSISQLDGLVSLVVNSRPITDDGLAYLVRLNKLTQLALKVPPDAHITSTGMSHIAALTQMTHLTLSAAIDDESFMPLAGAPNLTLLRLLFARIGARGLAALNSCPTLRNLELHHQSITRADLEAIASIRQLARLELTGIEGLVDEDLPTLAQMPNLQVAVFRDCPALTDASLQSLRDALPECYVGRQRPPES